MTTSASTAVAADRTVLDRLVESGITKDRALSHLRGGWVLLDGQIVTDPTTPTARGSHVELRAVRRSDAETGG